MRCSRRSFLEQVGIGGGAVLLGPVASSLFNEAQGAVKPLKRIVFFLTGNGTAPYYSTPKEFDVGSESKWDPVLPGSTNYTLPDFVQALAPYKNRMLLVDGLPNHIPQSQHSCGYGALSAIPCARGMAAEYGGPPGGITIDQYIAGKLGTDTPYRSVLYGISKNTKAVEGNVFASGTEQPEPAFMSPKLLYNSLFKTIATTAGGARQRLLLDSLRYDIKRLNTALAGPEKRKLENYLAILEDYDARQKSLPGLMCKTPDSPPAMNIDDGTVEDRLDASMEMGILALACGMTRVLGIASGCGFGHNAPDFGRLGVNFEGHSPPAVQGPSQIKIHNYHAGLIARLVSVLSSVKEGDKTAFDNTVIVYMNDNGDAHHASHNRFPLVIVGDAGGTLKSDGRFIRYPSSDAMGARSMADFFVTLTHAMGVPNDTFGSGGVERVQGPLSEMLA